MDAEYIVPRLLKIASLLYGKNCKPFAKEKQGVYIFGAKEHRAVLGKGKKAEPIKVTNKVSKGVAIYIILNK